MPRWSRRPLCIAALGLLAGCLPRSGNTLVDRVAQRIDPFGSCLAVGQTRVFAPSAAPGPPALLLPSAFRRADVRQAAERIAIPWRPDARSAQRIIGADAKGECATYVGTPALSGRFAFLDYHSSDGRIGAVAFENDRGDWRVAEDARLGFW